jgi:hypothetical protein
MVGLKDSARKYRLLKTGISRGGAAAGLGLAGTAALVGSDRIRSYKGSRGASYRPLKGLPY